MTSFVLVGDFSAACECPDSEVLLIRFGGLRDLQVGKAEPLDGCQDVVGGFGPNERPGVGIDGLDISFDGGFQFRGGAVDATADLLFAEIGKEALDLVEPGGRCRRVVDVPARPLGEPVADRLRLWLETLSMTMWTSRSSGTSGLDRVQESAEFARPMPGETTADDFAGCRIESREQRQRAMRV